jgi:hypothetical protein
MLEQLGTEIRISTVVVTFYNGSTKEIGEPVYECYSWETVGKLYSHAQEWVLAQEGRFAVVSVYNYGEVVATLFAR